GISGSVVSGGAVRMVPTVDSAGSPPPPQAESAPRRTTDSGATARRATDRAAGVGMASRIERPPGGAWSVTGAKPPPGEEGDATARRATDRAAGVRMPSRIERPPGVACGVNGANRSTWEECHVSGLTSDHARPAPDGTVTGRAEA